MVPLPADDRRLPGWRVLREYLSEENRSPKLRILPTCSELIRCLPALLCHKERPEDASSEPHSITHAPEALRYAVMARCPPPAEPPRHTFRFPRKKPSLFD